MHTCVHTKKLNLSKFYFTKYLNESKGYDIATENKILLFFSLFNKQICDDLNFPWSRLEKRRNDQLLFL